MPHTDLFIKFSKFERATEFRLAKKSYIGILNALGPAASDSIACTQNWVFITQLHIHTKPARPRAIRMLKVSCRVLLNFAELQYWINSKLGTPSRDFSWLIYIRLYILLLYIL